MYNTETWAYAGVRRTESGKRTHAWINPEDGKPRFWSDRRDYIVGALYDMEIDRRDGHLYRRGDPEYTGRHSEETENKLSWQLAHDLAQRKLRRDTAERKFKRDGDMIDQACEPLCHLAAGIKSYDELDLLMTSVKRRMIHAWDKGGK